MVATVLVVEDEPLIRLAALQLVEDAGFEGLEASNSDEAIRIMEQRPAVRLVFTDVDMSGSIDGLKLAHYIRGRWPSVHLIVASGKAILTESSLPHGARFFAKPYPEHAIADAIKAMLASA